MKIKVVTLETIEKEQLATYAEKKTLVKRGKEVWKIPLDQIAIRSKKGKMFNHRTDFGSIIELAEGIKESKGTDPIKVDLLKDGTAILTDGERRYRAYILLNSQNIDGFDTMDAIINSNELTDIDRYVLQHTSNNSKNFKDLEEADLYKTLFDEGLTQAEIARRLGVSKMHVSNQLRLAGISEVERELIKDGAVSSTAVLDLIKKGVSSSDRVDAIKGGSSGDGQTKLKVKDIPIMADLEPPKLDPNATPETICKELLVWIKALDKLIGTDSKMSDITFKMDNRIRDLQRMVKGKKINEEQPF